jgi:cytochrome c oxidase cbb3-type subunit 3
MRPIWMRHLSPRRAARLAACVAVFATGCHPGRPPEPAPRPSAVMDFATLYGQNCAACHGSNGQSGPAIDLGNPEYQSLIDDATLRKWIANGMPGTEMPAFAQSAGGMLTDAQVDALVAGMRKQWRTENALAGVTPPPYASAAADKTGDKTGDKAGDAHRGQQTYEARCASCHDSGGQQIASPAYLSLISDQALRSIIIAGRPDIGQPDWRHDGPGGNAAAPLTAQDVDDIVTYLGTLRNAAPQAAPAQSGR